MIVVCPTCQSLFSLSRQRGDSATCPRCGSPVPRVHATEMSLAAEQQASATALQDGPEVLRMLIVRADPPRPAHAGTHLGLPPESDPLDTAHAGLLKDLFASNVTPLRNFGPLPEQEPADDVDFVPGDIDVPGYEILGILGRGGMGLVYKARDVGLKRIVALKVILAGKHAGAVVIARFRSEAQAVARLQHPHIVQIYETGTHQGLPYFSLEYCGGGSLARKIDTGPLPPRAAAELVEKLARAMHVAHGMQIVHRDLKPANVLLTATGEPKITDFGLAKHLDDASQTRTGAVMGTPSYMAPEQASGEGHRVGPLSDLYALGAILYEVLTGRPPFRAPSSLETIRLVLDRDPVPLTSLQPQTPRDLETICLKCLEKDPERRYADCQALADDLCRWLSNMPIEARPASALERAGKWIRRNPSRAVISGLVGVLGLVCLLGYGLHVQRERQLDQARVRFAHQHFEAKGLLATNNWPKAAELLVRLKGALETQPALGDETLRVEVDQEYRLAVRKNTDAKEESQTRQETRPKFWRHFNDAQVREVPLIGMENVADRAKVLQAAQDALALFDLASAGDAAVPGDKLQRVLGFLENESERTSIITACYELLLLWADMEAPPPEAKLPAAQLRLRADRALALVERAKRLGAAYGIESHVYWARRAQYEAQRDGTAAEHPVPAGEPSLALDWFLKGKEEYRRQRYEDAYRAFSNVLKRQSEHYWALYYQGLCALQMKQYTGAKAVMTGCRNNREDLPEPLLLRGYAASELGQQYMLRSEAEKRRAAAAETRNELGVARDAEETAGEKRRAALQEFKEARSDYDEALAQAPPTMHFSILVNRGILHSRQHNWRDALADLNKAAQLRPDDHRAYLYLALAHQGAGDLAHALVRLDQAIERTDEKGPLHEVRADVLLAQSARAAARIDFDKALADPKIEGSRAAALRVKVGRMLFNDEHYHEALSYCVQALQDDEKNELAHHLHAELLLKDERHTEAGRALDCYLKLSANPTAEAYQIRGLIHIEVHELAKAQDMFTNALKFHPENYTSHVYRGKTFLLQNAARAARDDFAEYLKRFPRVPAAAKDRSDYIDALCGHACADALLGHIMPALAGADTVRKLAPLSTNQLYQLAYLYTQVMVQAEAKRDDPEHSQYAALGRRRALQRLSEVLVSMQEPQRLDFWNKVVRRDPNLAGLRQTPAFAELATQFRLPER